MASTETYFLLNLTSTTFKPSQSAKTQFLLYDYLIPTLGTFIIILNFLVVLSSGLILKKGQQPRSTYLFLGNVAMTDMITGIAVVFGQVFPKSSRDHYVCAFQLGLIVSSTLASVYSVGLIAIDRFLYILHGIQYQRWVYPNRARFAIVLTWVIGGIIGYLPMMGWYGDTQNGRVCWFILLAPKHLILLTVIVGVVPLLTVIALYSIILYNAIKKIIQLQQIGSESNANSKLRMNRGGGGKKQADSVENIENGDGTKKKSLAARIFKKSAPKNSTPNKWKAIKVVLFTTSSFVITWGPYFVVCLYYVYQCENNRSKRCKDLSILIAAPLAILGFVNSLINPIIYAWWHRGFREYVQKRVSVGLVKLRRRTDKRTVDVITNTSNQPTKMQNTSTSGNTKNNENTSDTCKELSTSSTNPSQNTTKTIQSNSILITNYNVEMEEVVLQNN